MPPLIVLLAASLNDLPQPPGTTPTVTVPATPTASPVATPLPEATVATVATPTPAPVAPQSDGGGPSTGYVILIVAIVLGTVVLIAWLLKPLAARRLIGEHEVESGDEASEPVATAWPARQDTTAGPPVVVSVSEFDESVGEFEPVDTPDEAPREPAEEEPATIVDAEAIVGITLTVRELLEFANAGQLLRGFDLYSQSYLRRFRAETGLTDEQFAEEYGSIPAPSPEARIELAAVTNVEVLPDGRLSALISFGNGEEPPRAERFVFVRTAGRWLIDDIAGVG